MFLTPLIAMKVGENDKDEPIWELHEDFVWKADGTDKTITVPKGFQTDFASVPRLPLAYVACGNTAHEAAVIHDYLYRKGAKPNLTRENVDKVFLAIMEEMKMSWWRREAMYRAVRAGAGFMWKSKGVMDKMVYIKEDKVEAKQDYPSP
jgi:hypothetical protein